jgi:putative NADH-flavin reductase
MSGIVVFGAGGRAGSAAVAELVARGYEVTAVVRDPGRHDGLAREGVRVVAGDVTDPADVARISRGHDAVISGVYDPGADQAAFFAQMARALVKGLGEAGVSRLVSVGLASILPNAEGVPLMDSDGYPQEYRAFFLAHAGGNEILEREGGSLDWMVLSPAGDFDHGGTRTGGYRTAPGHADSRVSYADFAIALADEAVTRRHHRTHIGIEHA